jgi:predicted RNA-binding Zn-ribbon protein involved in translation (DUF1610 family)
MTLRIYLIAIPTLTLAIMSAQPKRYDDLTQEQKEARRTARKIQVQDERQLIIDRLHHEHAFDLAKQLEACGTPVPLVCSNCGTSKTVESQCRRRWCPSCAWAVQCERVAKWDLATRQMKWPLFVTLTVSNDPNPERIRSLRSDWSKMRRRKIIASKVTGGITTIEVTAGNGGWHPHLHLLCDCEWLACHVPKPTRRDSAAVVSQKCDHARLELNHVWSSVVKQPASIVSALRARSGDALAYSLKYAVKGSDLADSKLPIAPLIRVLSKSRMISAFGDFHGRIKPDDEEEKPKCQCPDCGEEKTWIPAEIAHRAIIQARDKKNGR